MDTPASSPDRKPTLEQLLRRGDVWRGRSQAADSREVVATGHAGLDVVLVSGGWPRGGLVDICLPEVVNRLGCFGGEWLLLAPAVGALGDAETFIALLNPPALPFASGLIQLAVPLDRLLIVRVGSKQDFVASFVELSRSRHCAALLAWQPARNLSYTELRKCQLACAEQQGLYFLLRSHKNKTQSSPAPLRLLLQLQGDKLQVEIFKQKGKFNSGVVDIPLPQNWLPQTAHRELGGSVYRPTAAPLRHFAMVANRPSIVPMRSKPRLKRRYF